MNISFAKRGHEQCESCLKYEEHACLADSLENPCDCCKNNQCDCCKRFTNAKRARKIEKLVQDDCDCCKRHQNFIDQMKAEKEKCTSCIEHNCHLERDRNARSSYKKDRLESESAGSNTIYLSLDLQKVLHEPRNSQRKVFT